MFTTEELKIIIDLANRVPVQGLEAMQSVVAIALKANVMIQQASVVQANEELEIAPLQCPTAAT